MVINKNYIIWSLVFVPISVGIFFIIRQSIILKLANNGTRAELYYAAKRLINPPEIVRAIYLTSTSVANGNKIDKLIDLANKTELNSVVIDIKDSSGYISYDSSVAEAEKYKTELVEIKDIDALVRKLHENGIYVIGRMAVFQDPILAKARPDWAVKNSSFGGTWYDNRRLAWIDPANRNAWQYFSALAKDALMAGIDEINLDYIRFPSDGNLEAMVFPAWEKEKTRSQVLKEFFKYMREELGNVRISVDLFGFVTTRTEDFGVGQVIEDAFEYFDYISPMVYPSHYPPNFLGFTNPAEHPYEVIYYTLSEGQKRLNEFLQKMNNEQRTFLRQGFGGQAMNRKPKIRPWIQDFKLGAEYTQAMVEAEIKATQDALGDQYNGFMLWNAGNNYHEGVF
ncbi:MAG: hypothetical protein A3B91_02265 [Candidatus Yanofskybacteria bacterium RIFCSPHIGHO2_02_FULL_41_29]|uniref:DUF4015 domain-containing protein n=1 Tax=Candidatus Yanofskybacteria bacterium RIFCSPHIGHO2_01_FULL_41_53 TaxID=1802663 RepID=A0A1F8EKR0_9BACT|nr:MAG: hypothetical protein A2650_01690 [Candidatus Yanofskybacteria bacterium RIFCSPHIGHO2_01_FULL_41_53]OGN12349.1 MAG: hypothetical protein A3B91_02265 [Candidatus Yanofskybacteria bacterium RIFCSPHIGHO2_02_FULL_41_29]OGN17214.1 MAG: hypothetical protein A3F48_00245 [Candidatus Yanofskybacteria bacterium RIFCSPHIGHO2_12_FULL_41_9]OGN23215.1 MAG: hypothetical protein A2916_02680 [Candidatus Yanofskybacteria bacterium RIFCSPLOWO2_01_FULL_41_67]OGN28888.1 MAG: hypothetical protein A3H54_01960 